MCSTHVSDTDTTFNFLIFLNYYQSRHVSATVICLVAVSVFYSFEVNKFCFQEIVGGAIRFSSTFIKH